MSDNEGGHVPDQDEDQEADKETFGDVNVTSSETSLIGKMKSRVSLILPSKLSQWLSPSTKTKDDLIGDNSGKSRRRCRSEIENEYEETRENEVTAFNYKEIAEHEDRGFHINQRITKILNEEEILIVNKKDGNINSSISMQAAKNQFNTRPSNLLQQPPTKRSRLDNNKNECESFKPRRTLTSTPIPESNISRGVGSNYSLAAGTLAKGGICTRTGFLNLYGNLNKRDPAFNFKSENKDTIKNSSRDLTSQNNNKIFGFNYNRGLGSRKTLNFSSTSLPNLRRQPLNNLRVSAPLIEEDESSNRTILEKNNVYNGHSNSRTINKNSRIFNGVDVVSGDTASEGSTEGSNNPFALRLSKNSDTQSRTSSVSNGLNFYAHLQGPKSLFLNERQNQQQVCGVPMNKSTLSLSSLNRRHFNTSIYGSTSALSDSRLLVSASSPFYNGPTTYGGASAYTRFNSPYVASGAGARITPTVIRPSSSLSTRSSSNNSLADGIMISNSTKRILSVLNDFSSPLNDARKMAIALRTQQQDSQEQLNHEERQTKPDGVFKPIQVESINPKENDLQIARATRSSYSYSPYSRSSLNPSTAAKLQNGDKMSPFPPKLELQVPTMSQLLNILNVQDQTIRIQKYVKENPINVGPYAPVKYSPKSYSFNAHETCDGLWQQQNHTNKIRSKMTGSSRRVGYKDECNADIAHTPINLPNIVFPIMKSVPQFDIALPKSSTAKGKINSKSLSSTEAQHSTNFAFKSSVTSKVNIGIGKKIYYEFGAPLLLISNQHKSYKQLKQFELIFQFSSPLQLKFSHQYENGTIKETPFKSYDAFNSQMFQRDGKDESPNTTVSVTDKSGPNNFGFGNQFKKSSTEWECNTCMIRNKEDVNKCVACESSRFLNVPAKLNTIEKLSTSNLISTSFGFGKQFNKDVKEWECETCMVRNKQDSHKCIACVSPRILNTSEKHMASASFGFGNQFSKDTNEWECKICMIRNKHDVDKCIACESPRFSKDPLRLEMLPVPDNFKFTSSPLSQGDFTSHMPLKSFGSQFKKLESEWECVVCMVRNNIEVEKCLACETPRKDTLKSSAMSTKQLSTPIVNKSANLNVDMWKCNACQADNKNIDLRCLKCQTRKPLTDKSKPSINASLPPPKFKFGFFPSKSSFGEGEQPDDGKWSCEACLAKNTNTQKICVCCDQPQLGSINNICTTTNLTSDQKKNVLSSVNVHDTEKDCKKPDYTDMIQSTISINKVMNSTSAETETHAIIKDVNCSAINKSSYVDFQFGNSNVNAKNKDKVESKRVTFNVPDKKADDNMSQTINSNFTITPFIDCLVTSNINTGINSTLATTSTNLTSTSIIKSNSTPTPISLSNSFIFGSLNKDNLPTAQSVVQKMAGTTKKIETAPITVSSVSSDMNKFKLNQMSTTPQTIASKPFLFGNTTNTSTTITSALGRQEDSGLPTITGIKSSSLVSCNNDAEKLVQWQTDNTFFFGNGSTSIKQNNVPHLNIFGNNITETASNVSIPISTLASAPAPNAITSTLAAQPSIFSTNAALSNRVPFTNFGNGNITETANGSENVTSNHLLTQTIKPLSFDTNSTDNNLDAMDSTSNQYPTNNTAPVTPFIFNTPFNNSVSTSVTPLNSSAQNVFGNTTAPATLTMQSFGGFSTNTNIVSKPAYDFASAAAALQNTNTSVFNFGASSINGGSCNNNINTVSKPAFNFSQLNQPPTFNFTGNSLGNEATTNATPFQFNAGVMPVQPTTNIFAINPLQHGSQSAQARRKIRAPTRRLTPR